MRLRKSSGDADAISNPGIRKQLAYGAGLLSKIEENPDLWWEVESEIRSLIEDILYKEVTKKTGILIEVNMLWIKE